MQVVIAEKPSVAKEIAQVIGATTPGRDYWSGNGWTVTWMYGHLLELGAPEAGSRWTLDSLPIIPRRFVLTPVRGRDGDDAGIRNRLEVIRRLFDECSGIVVATDAGREGELIFRRVYAWLGCRKPFRRLWISSLTPGAIEDGFRDLRPGSDYDLLAAAAEQRSQADWIVGINATRAFTLASGMRSVLSLGRVQTPTLCMVCERYVHNKTFKSEPFWFIEGESSKDGITFKWRGEKRYDNIGAGEAEHRRVQAAGTLTVKEVETKRVNDAPPLLHDIASLQKIANSRYGYTAEQTLNAAQALYEKKLITYPRTGSRYIPEDVYETIPALLSKFRDDPVYGPYVRAIDTPSRRSVDDDKITDHHALLVTGGKAEGLPAVEHEVYDLVLMRCVEAFSAVNVADVTAVRFDAGGVAATVRGRKDVSLGWRAVGKGAAGEDDVELSDVDEVEMSMRPLPEMHEGDRLPIGRSQLVEDKTKPKPLLTDATLITAMENAGRKADDKAVAEALRETGIGTAATRAAIIETLVKRNYVERQKKKLVPTPLGLEVYGAVRGADVANVEMTARWEICLEDIAEGKMEPIEFARGIREYARRLTKDLVESEGVLALKAKMEEYEVKCPRCGKPIRIGDKSAWCKECNFTVWRTVAGKRLGDTAMKHLLTRGQTGIIRGFRSKSGKEFEAAVAIDTEGHTSLLFPKRKDRK